MRFTNSKPIAVAAYTDEHYALFSLLFKFKIITQLMDARQLTFQFNGVGLSRVDKNVVITNFTADSGL